MRNKQKNNIKSERTKIKVVIGYAFSLLVIFLFGYITYISFQKITNSVESLSNNKSESTLIKSIATGIAEIRTYSKIYSITFNPSDFNNYKEKTKKVSDLIDSLELHLVNKEKYNKVDSLDVIFKAYIISINNWFSLKATGNKNDFKRLAEVLKKDGDLLTHSSKNVPLTKINTVTKILEKPIVINSISKTDSQNGNSRRTFLEKIFGSKKKTTPSHPIPPTSVNQQITTETYTQIDTGYYNQVETLIAKIKNVLISSEKNKKSHNVRLAKLDIQLLNYQSELIKKINYLLKTIEQTDRSFVNQRILQAKQTADDASENLFYIGIFALVILLVFTYIIFTDITKITYYRRNLEKAKSEAEKLAKAKEEFLANMSHEIRTPLTGIIGFSEQLESTSLKENQKQQVLSIVNSSEHLLTIVNDILDYSKIEAGSLKFERIGFSINDIILDVITIMNLNATKKNLQLLYEPNSDLDNNVSGDPFRLKQVLINLIGNSIKFTDNGYIRVEVSLAKSKSGYILRCDVKDTGIGIDENKIKDIFMDFSQADNSISRRYGGTGLGLAISKKIVEMQNGRIWARSRPQEGSVFSFEIPYSEAEINEYKFKNYHNYEYGDELKDKKLLLIDDDRMMHLLLEPILQSWQASYTFCNKSVHALELLNTYSYDIIIIDMQMPEINGIDLMKQIKTQEGSKNKKAKLILCTANVLVDISKLNTFISDCSVLYKPFKKAELWSMLCAIEGLRTVPQNTLVRIDNTIKENYSLKSFKTYANEDIKTLKLFIRAFISQSKADLAEMKIYGLEKNYKQVGDIAHKLKNTCGQLQARKVIPILMDIETLTTESNTDPKKVEEQISALAKTALELFSQLEKELH